MKICLFFLLLLCSSCAAFRQAPVARMVHYRVTVLLDGAADRAVLGLPFREDFLLENRPEQVTLLMDNRPDFGPEELRERLNAAGITVLAIHQW